jgi:hypothetical protein
MFAHFVSCQELKDERSYCNLFGPMPSCSHMSSHIHFKRITWIWTKMILLQLQQQQQAFGIGYGSSTSID